MKNQRIKSKKHTIITVLFIMFLSVLSFSFGQRKNIKRKDVKIYTYLQADTVKIMHIIGYSPKFYSTNAAVTLRKEVEKLAKNNPSKIYISGQTNSPKISLTFDDGPDPIFTESILKTLKKYNIKSTFFCIGNKVEKYPNVVIDIDSFGHTLANHSYSHPKFANISDDDIKLEILKTNNLIYNITRKYPVFFRPPYGSVNQNILNDISYLNMTCIYWSLDVYDWLETKDFVIENIDKLLRNDEIILLHCNKNTAENLPKIIETIQAKGYEIVPLKKLIKTPAYQK